MTEKLLSNRVKAINESATIAMSQRSRTLKNEGKDVINLSIGEPDFNTPEIVKEAAIEAIHQNYSKYPPVPGFENLRKVICEKFRKENNLEFTPEQISVSTGAKQCIANVVMSLVNKGDEVILPSPYWVSYRGLVELAGGTVIEIPSGIETDFKISANQLKAAITPRTKLIIYSSPCNPSGSIYTEKDLSEIAKVISAHPKVVVLSDEIYEYINFTNQKFSLGAIPEIKDQVVTVNGVAKGFAMTGWRIGYMGGPLWLIRACNKVQGQFTSGANSIAQMAAIKAISEGEKLTSEMKTAFLRRRNLVVEELRKIPHLGVNEPKGAFYVFPDASYYIGRKIDGNTILDSDHLCSLMLEKTLVACVGGTSFGAPNNFRISYATSDEILREAIRRMTTFFEQIH